jgi:hypothetical protein
MISFLLTFFQKPYNLCRKNIVKDFVRVTLKMKLLHAHVSERAKLCCRPSSAIEACLYSELSHLLSATFVHKILGLDHVVGHPR